ncbi:MAG: Tn3 family transposase, partial [Bacilli bacterium]
RSRTTLGWLKTPTGFPSPETFLKLADKIEYIKDLHLDISLVQHFHSNRLLQLYRMAMRYEPYAFRDFKENKRYALLTILLINLSKDLIDKAFEVHDRQMLTLISKGRKAQEEIQKNNGKKLNEKIVQFASIGKSLIKAKEEGIDPFKALETIVNWENFVLSVNEAEKL